MTTKADKAVERGIQDARRGIDRNPYLWIGGKYKHLASWWDKGHSEEKAKSNM